MSRAKFHTLLGIAAGLTPRVKRRGLGPCRGGCEDCDGLGRMSAEAIKEHVERYRTPEHRLTARFFLSGMKCPNCRGTGGCPLNASVTVDGVAYCRACATAKVPK